MPEPRRYRDVADLLAGATERAGLAEVPGKSGATLERVVIDGQGYVLKHLDLAEDWTMRASGCLPGAPLVLWERGILARLPGCLNQPIVGAAPEPHGCALLTRDVTPWLVPATDAPVPLDQHARLLRHMAAMQAEFWACGDEFDVVPAMHRYLELSPWMAAAEAAVGSRHLVPLAGRQGLAAAGRGRPRGGRGCHPAGARPGSAGGGAGRDAADVRAQQLEARQPRHRRRGAHRRARLGAAGARGPTGRPGPVPRDQLPPPAPVQGGLDRGLPGGAGGLRHRHRVLVGPSAGAVPAGCLLAAVLFEREIGPWRRCR